MRDSQFRSQIEASVDFLSFFVDGLEQRSVEQFGQHLPE